MGPCIAGGAYLPALSDVIFMVKGTSFMGLGGPNLVKGATGQTIDAETLGGARHAHRDQRRRALRGATTTPSASRKLRELVARLPAAESGTSRPALAGTPAGDRPTRCTTCCPPITACPTTCTRVLACLVDGGALDEFQARSRAGDDLRRRAHRGMAGRRDRQPARAHQGRARARSRASAASSTPRAPRRSRTSSTAAIASGIPLLFVQDVSGFMVGPEAEHEGIIRAGARFVEAMATARVPKIVLTVNHASGAGYYAMAGQGFDPDFIFSWPTGRMGVMEGESAVQAVHGPAIEKAKRRRRAARRRDAAESIDEMRADYEHQLDARYRRRPRLHRRDRVSRGDARRARDGAARSAAEPGPHLGPFVLPATSTTHDGSDADVHAWPDRADRARRRRAGILGRLARGAAPAGRGRSDRLPDARLSRRSHDVAFCRSRRSATRTWATRATSSARWRACCRRSPSAASASSPTRAA